ncbi:hypothetical protein ES703_56425 [subsurface metagenome]
MSVPSRQIIRGMFGKPVLEAGGNGRVSWVPPGTKGGHQVTWAALLNAGVQTDHDDFAKVIIPVNEMPFNDLKIVRLEPYYTANSGIDMGVCVYLHDPNDLDQRIELSHTPLTNSLAGWRELNWPDDVPVGHAYFWYGNVTDTPNLCPTSGTAYTLAQFRADKIFSTWRIYKITLDYGYYTGGGTMDGCYLTHAVINNVAILLEPSVEEILSFSGAVYIKSDTAGDDNPRQFETTTKRLRDAYLLVTTQDQKFGDATSQDYTVATTDEPLHFRHIDISTLYFKNANGGNGTVTILGTEE